MSYRQNAMASPAPIPSTPGSSQRLRASGSSSMSKESAHQSPFVQNSHGHPQFNPQKLGTKMSGSSAASLKPPKAPEKPLMPYMRYSRKVWDEVKAANQELKLWEIGKIIGQMWRELPDADKQEFVEEYESEKSEYEKSLKSYHNSPAYQAFVAAKSKAQQGGDDKESSNDRGMSSKAAFNDRRIEIQPAEDEEDIDDGMSVKHVAHARYVRNHRLVHEIFSDIVVPDVRSVVTTARMQVLKRQVHSLTMHQKKLETELQQIEEKFESKKRKFVDSSSTFQEDLVRTCRKPIDEEAFQLLIEQQTELIKKEREREKERQAELQREREAAAAAAALAAENEPAAPSVDQSEASVAAADAAASAPVDAAENADKNETSTAVVSENEPTGAVAEPMETDDVPNQENQEKSVMQDLSTNENAGKVKLISDHTDVAKDSPTTDKVAEEEEEEDKKKDKVVEEMKSDSVAKELVKEEEPKVKPVENNPSPVDSSAAEKVAEKVAEPVIAPATEPVTAPVTEQVTAPAAEPIAATTEKTAIATQPSPEAKTN